MFCLDCKKTSSSDMICPNCSNAKVQNNGLILNKQDFEDELRQKRKLKRLELEAKKLAIIAQ